MTEINTSSDNDIFITLNIINELKKEKKIFIFYYH